MLEAGVEFIVVEGLAAVIQGAPVTTMDLDIVHRQTAGNLGRLMDFLTALGAIHRRPDDRVLAPTKGQLAARGHVLLTTRNGPLDLLAAIEQGQDYEQLLTHSETIPYRGYRLLVFRLQKRVELKRASRDPRDRQRLPVLEETLRQIKGT
jgi:hypothetical protein